MKEVVFNTKEFLGSNWDKYSIDLDNCYIFEIKLQDYGYEIEQLSKSDNKVYTKDYCIVSDHEINNKVIKLYEKINNYYIYILKCIWFLDKIELTDPEKINKLFDLDKNPVFFKQFIISPQEYNINKDNEITITKKEEIKIYSISKFLGLNYKGFKLLYINIEYPLMLSVNYYNYSLFYNCHSIQKFNKIKDKKEINIFYKKIKEIKNILK